MANIRVQDDLYEYVNHDWIEQAVIPEDRPTTGGFATLADDVEKLLTKDINEMVESGNYPNDYLRRLGILYKKILDVKERKRLGIRPELKRLNKLNKIKDINALNRNYKDLILDDYSLPFYLSVDADMKDTNVHKLYLSAPSTILPDVTYYKEEAMAQQKEMMLGLYSQMATSLLNETKLSEEEVKQYVEDTLKFDAIIATLVKSSEEESEYAKQYNPTKTRTVARLVKPLKFRKIVEKLVGEVPEVIIVTDPRFLKGFNTLFNEDTFVLYKHWAYVKDLISNAKYLSEKLREMSGTYSRALYGIKVMTSVERFAYNTAGGLYSEPLGLYYGEKYFGKEAKKDVEELVHLVINKYKERLANSDILSKETSEKAILKLSTMRVKMGYPDKVKDRYELMTFNEEDGLFDILNHISRVLNEDHFTKLNKPVNRDEWHMPGHLVNASYNPFSNDITFPAAILQAPFYSIKQSRSENLGGIGAVIGHEISHAFDNNGALFDELGNLNSWWTKEDYKKFQKKTKDMIKQFDGIELPFGGKANGKLIVSENIADNGGVAVTLGIMKDLKEKSYEEYFLNWARVWCIKAKPEYSQLLLRVDVHAPAILRANMQPRNFPEWYETFKVTKKDKMYIAPNKRVVIW